MNDKATWRRNSARRMKMTILLASESVEAFNVLSLCWFNPTNNPCRPWGGAEVDSQLVGKRKFCTEKIGSRPVTAFLLFLTIFGRNGSEIADLKSKKNYPFPAAFVTTLMSDWEKEKAKSQQKFEAQPLQNCRSRNTHLYFGEIRSYKSTKSRDQQMKEN